MGKTEEKKELFSSGSSVKTYMSCSGSKTCMFLHCSQRRTILSSLQSSPFSLLSKLINFIFGCIVSWLLHGLFFSCGKWGYLLLQCVGFSLWWLLWLQSTGSRAHGLQQLWHLESVIPASGLQSTGLIVVAHGLSCSKACGIFLNQELNACLLHWQGDSLPLSQQGSPSFAFYVQQCIYPKLYLVHGVRQRLIFLFFTYGYIIF